MMVRNSRQAIKIIAYKQLIQLYFIQMADPKIKLPGIDAVITATLSQNLKTFSGDTSPIKVENMSFDLFRAETGKIKTGRLLLVYTSSARASMIVILPDAAQKAFLSRLPDGKAAAGDESSLSGLMNRITGNLPFLCALKEKGVKSNVFTIQKPYSDKYKDQLLWDSSECNIYKCSAFGAVLYLSVNTELQKSVEGFLKTDPAFLRVLREGMQSQTPVKDGLFLMIESDIRITIKNPLEFIIGSCFLPREAYIGKADTFVVFREILSAQNTAAYITDGMIWYRFWVISGGVEYSIFYSVDVKGQQQKYFQFFNRLFTEMVKQTSVFLRSQFGFERAKGKIVSKPLAEDIGEAVIFNTDISWEGSRISARIIVPESFFTGYLSALLEPWEAEALKKNQRSVLLYILSLNSTIFGKNIETFYRPPGTVRSGRGLPPIGVSRILAILDTLNAGRLVQNYFLASGGSLDEFQSLFQYKYCAADGKTVKIGRDALFNKIEYKKYIPKALHEDWDLCSGTAADYDIMLELNEKALRGIYCAIQEDKLLMPYKVAYILYNEYQKPLDARFKAEISRCLEEDRWKSLIEIIPKKTGQQVISAIPTQKLGIALIAGRPEVGELSPFISKLKRQELEEELRLNIKKYEKGGISAENVYLAMKELLETLEQLAAPDDEMI